MFIACTPSSRLIARLNSIRTKSRTSSDCRRASFRTSTLSSKAWGPDAHTASLFPGDPLIDDRKGIAAATYVEKMSQWRITLLPGVLLAAKHTVFLVAGEDKADAVHNVFEGEYNPHLYPSQIVTHHGRGVAWFTDQAASRLVPAR